MRPELKVLFLTGYADLQELEDIGGHEIIRKPFQEDEFKTKVFGFLQAPPRSNVIRFSRPG